MSVLSFCGFFRSLLKKFELPSYPACLEFSDNLFSSSNSHKKLKKFMIQKNNCFCGLISSKTIQHLVTHKKNYDSVQLVFESQKAKGMVESLNSVNYQDSMPVVGDNQVGLVEGKNYQKNEQLMLDNDLKSTVSEGTKSNSNKYCLRTHTCGELNDTHIGKKVRLMGWIDFFRMNKFIILRDAYGKVQLIISESNKVIQKTWEKLTLESVIEAEGIVCLRPPGQENPKLKTGAIEVNVTNLKILNLAKKLPFTIKDRNKPHETLRMKYRYLDLRYEKMQKNLRMRSKLLHQMRRFLIEHGNFVEVETPTLFKSTPGGAQEFLVPTQLKGKYYSLVQSPQQFKQLLMIGSIDRYFQVARCYRDEPQRNDRQPEFTQLDLEVSFCEREQILNLIEDMIRYSWPNHLPALGTPFPRLSFAEALGFYGTEKPDLRFDWRCKDLTNLFNEEKDNCKGSLQLDKFFIQDDFEAYAFVARRGKAIQFSDELLKEMEIEMSEEYPRNGYIFLKIISDENAKIKLESFFCSAVAAGIKKITEYEVGDVICLAIGSRSNTKQSLDKIRINFANYLEDKKVLLPNAFSFVWILDFPLFEIKNDQISSTHHPFTQPHPEDSHLLKSSPLQVRGLNYDLVLNGTEIGGGSIRVQDFELQKLILQILKIDPNSLSHLMEGLASGAPPHGGIALGLDRLVAELCGAESIRDVMAFPKSGRGIDLMSGAPSEIRDYERKLYNIT